MYVFMSLQMTFPAEWLMTHITVIWMVCTMYMLMRLQTSLGTEYFITHITMMWTVSSMYELMSVQYSRKTKRFITESTATWVFSTVQTLMWPIPCITVIQIFFTKYLLMYRGIAFPAEWLTTHITVIGMLPIKHVFTSLEIALFTELVYYSHHSSRYAPCCD